MTVERVIPEFMVHCDGKRIPQHILLDGQRIDGVMAVDIEIRPQEFPIVKIRRRLHSEQDLALSLDKVRVEQVIYVGLRRYRVVEVEVENL